MFLESTHDAVRLLRRSVGFGSDGSSVLSGGGEQVIVDNDEFFLRISSCFEGLRSDFNSS